MVTQHYGLHLGSIVLAVVALLILILCVLAIRWLVRRIERLRQQP